ncbi:MAG: DUF1993 domain-containing protein [Burkholderiales bacterium]
MQISMFQASVPCFAHMLGNLSAILGKAEAHCEAKKIDPLALVAARLYPNMLPLARQVMVACDAAKGAVARLAGIDNPKHEDVEKTLPELRARIAKTQAFVASLTPAQIDGSEERPVVLKFGARELNFTGLQYLTSFALPNFYFHVTTAYDILRHNGVELGKSDYLAG